MSFKGNIDPETILSLIENTAPFIFSEKYQLDALPKEIFEKYPQDGWLYIINSFSLKSFQQLTAKEKWVAYYLLCLSAHWATVMTYVPTDVDSKIRHVLWYDQEHEKVIDQMIDIALKIPQWDVSLVSKRTFEDKELGKLSGHYGELLTVYSGALGMCIKRDYGDKIALLEKAIDEELEREEAFVQKYLQLKGEEISLLKIATILAHNLGDLSRVLTFWELSDAKLRPFQKKYSRLGVSKKKDSYFYEAGLLNKDFMVYDNSRHLCLREAKDLRKSHDFLLPISPFLDDWGEMMGSYHGFGENSFLQLINALLEGAKRIPQQVGYTRALCGLNRTLPKGIKPFEKKISKTHSKILKELKLEEQSKISGNSFQQRLSKQVEKMVTNFNIN